MDDNNRNIAEGACEGLIIMLDEVRTKDGHPVFLSMISVEADWTSLGVDDFRMAFNELAHTVWCALSEMYTLKEASIVRK